TPSSITAQAIEKYGNKANILDFQLDNQEKQLRPSNPGQYVRRLLVGRLSSLRDVINEHGNLG
ncbi:hypothetical protein JTE90_029417, partial [Oedothorax gibbosus]